ncbi:MULTISPECIES: carbohydrate ABC transporter permease [unclassified Oceanispirochaeta]|uniref:carbohydrate ABC transporter permease n=1 Tax=unclassified Oceanispirochaeta TaxID=2635722 RepID=UPI001314892E|nr:MULTISPECIES: carbohydrate ABC transporter permease [unclassified Oceanispirochaeta]MBF9016553.1 carbohydrate ABC transporter permease [Oceanispirochaeta sp. M2]NPD73015.1 carbohydrate ABC transporter permease [Oceanispirochaeta sp. M1]
MKQHKKTHPVVIAILALLMLSVLLPMIWGFFLSFRSNEEIAGMSGLDIHSIIPEVFTFINYFNFFDQTNFPRVLVITLYVCSTVTVISLLINTMAAYAFAKLSFPGKDLIFSIILATLILPIELLIIPLYGQILKFGMVNKLSSLIIPFVASGFGIFYMRQFIKGIPVELEEAAYMDGCSRFVIFFRIVLPLCRTALVTLGVIIFLQQWDSFLVPVTFISSKEKRVLQVILTDLHSGVYFNDYGILYAGIVIASVPILLLFAFIQKYYMEGIASSGIKG